MSVDRVKEYLRCIEREEASIEPGTGLPRDIANAVKSTKSSEDIRLTSQGLSIQTRHCIDPARFRTEEDCDIWRHYDIVKEEGANGVLAYDHWSAGGDIRQRRGHGVFYLGSFTDDKLLLMAEQAPGESE